MAEILVVALIFIASIFTAIFGVLTGLGGGILIVPILTFFQVDIRHAMGVSLISIIALSLTTATTKTSQLLTNIEVGIFLETAAVVGAICGAMLLPFLPVKVVSIGFGLIILFIAGSKKEHTASIADDQGLEEQIQSLNYYTAKKLGIGWIALGFSGMLSGILGIGSGAFKVLAMERVIGLPYKVATSTSSMMVGITAGASIGIYFFNNYIRYDLVFPVVLGIYLGSFLGAKLLAITRIQILRRIFVLVLYVLGLQMMYKGLVS